MLHDIHHTPISSLRCHRCALQERHDTSPVVMIQTADLRGDGFPWRRQLLTFRDEQGSCAPTCKTDIYSDQVETLLFNSGHSNQINDARNIHTAITLNI